MSEAYNGESLSECDGRKPRGAYTGERLSVRKEQAIINALANGEPIERIGRRLHCSKHTAMAVRERESDDIARRKQLIAASAARLAANGFDRLNEEMDAGKIKGALLVPVTGMAIDKVIALSNDPAIFMQHQHVHIEERHLKPMTFEDYLREIRGESDGTASASLPAPPTNAAPQPAPRDASVAEKTPAQKDS